MSDQENPKNGDIIDMSPGNLNVKFQKESIYNKLLPYANDSDAEAIVLLAEIKANLSRAIMLREMEPGCILWVTRLCEYITIYGMKFTKEDHILFVKLMYELVTIPTLEPHLVSEFGTVLILLLKKKELISPDELELPWRALYELTRRVKANGKSVPGMYRFFGYIADILKVLVHNVKIYFPLSATQEILNELRPTLCPFDTTMSTTMEYLEWFLPVQLPPKHHSVGYQLWFDEFMTLWEVCHNAPKWENEMMWLMARVAIHNIGYIDWEPHIPLMFTRFVRYLKLPVSYNQTQKCKHHRVDITPIAMWITAVIGHSSSAQMYLEKFLKTIETYFHPANTGQWLGKLKELLTKLPYCFITRLHKERFAKPTWQTPVPEEYKLTDSDIDAFVKSIMPVAMTAIFSELVIHDASQALQYLATMRPSLVIPDVLEKVSSTLSSITTEPYKINATLSCMEAIARPMAQGSKNINKGYTYPEGPTHIMPLLFLLLPGIDSYDTEKCFVAFRLIAAYATFLPIANFSEPPTIMDEEERMIHETTSQFEDFLLQFLDRIFSFIESNSLESVRLESRAGDRKSKVEKITESGVRELCTILLLQTNDKIFGCALHKLRAFITGRILETKVAGQLAAVLCRIFARINGKETLRALLPALSEPILDIISESGDIIKEENLDGRLLHAMLLLSAVVDTTGSNLLPHINTLTNVLDHVLVLKSREGNSLACTLLKTVLVSLCNMIPYRFESKNPFRRWGETLKIETLKVNWYIPGEEEMVVTKQIFFKYLSPEISKLQQYCKDCNSLTREELLRSLNIVNAVVQACESVLPIWKEEPLIPTKSSLKWVQFTPTLGMKQEILMPDNSNVRQYIAALMTKVQKVLLENAEDDTKSLFVLIQIWSSLLLGKKRLTEAYEMKRRNFQVISKMRDKLVRTKGLMGPFVLQRAEIQHEARITAQSFTLTETHKQIMLELFTLATSKYADVRIQAQSSFFRALRHCSYSYTFIIPQLVNILKKDSVEYHDAYKGVLYILFQPQEEPIIMIRNWNILRSLWPAIVHSKTSEKLSVIRLRESLVESINKGFPTISIKFQIPETCLTIAKNFWETYPEPSLPEPTENEIEQGLKMKKEVEESNLVSYNGLVDDLLCAILEKNLHWRHRLMAMYFIRNLVHPDQSYPPKVVNYFLGALIHDSLQERKIAITVVVYMLKQQKRKHPKISIDPPSLSSKDGSQDDQKLIPGERSDNVWLQYDYNSRPLTAEQWDEPRFVHQLHIGYYTWPKKIEVYAPSSEQPNLDPNTRDLTDHEGEVYTFFNDPQNIEKLIKYFSLEEKKGKDKFNVYRYLLFKGIFRNYGIVFLKHFLPHLYKLVTEKQESSQRCAAEIIAGIIRGAKHWPFQMVCDMWDSLLPIIRLALSNIPVESTIDWGLCFAIAQRHRDPNRHHWLLECLMEEPPLKESESSFVECERLFTLQMALDEQSWRVSQLLQRVLKRTEDRLLANPFEIVRERLGSVLCTVFKPDLKFPNAPDKQLSPRMEDLINKIVPRLQSLINVNSVEESCKDAEDRDTAIRLLKTVCKWITNTVIRSQHGLHSGFYQIFPIICKLEKYDADEELTKLCTSTLAVLAQAFTLPHNMPAALDAIKKMSNILSWWSRSTCLEYLQVLVFYNMSILLSKPSWINCVKDIVLHLLEDERVEVRNNAGKVLSGLLHCTFIPNPENLLEEFKKKAKTELYTKERINHAKENTRNLKADAIRIRHAAVIGMCAFIQAHPYDIPQYIPSIIEYLSPHVNDPYPIPTTIRKTLDDFKRTHYNGWGGINGYTRHFTNEQLAVLQGLTMPLPHYT